MSDSTKKPKTSRAKRAKALYATALSGLARGVRVDIEALAIAYLGRYISFDAIALKRKFHEVGNVINLTNGLEFTIGFQE